MVLGVLLLTFRLDSSQYHVYVSVANELEVVRGVGFLAEDGGVTRGETVSFMILGC